MAPQLEFSKWPIGGATFDHGATTGTRAHAHMPSTWLGYLQARPDADRGGAAAGVPSLRERQDQAAGVRRRGVVPASHHDHHLIYLYDTFLQR